MINSFKCKICNKYFCIYKEKYIFNTLYSCKKCESIYTVNKNNKIETTLFIIDNKVLFCDGVDNYNYIVKNYSDFLNNYYEYVYIFNKIEYKDFCNLMFFKQKNYFYKMFCIHHIIFGLDIGSVISRLIESQDFKLEFKLITCANKAENYIKKQIKYQTIY